MAQMLDPDAIFATAEPTRSSGRAPQPRQNFAQDAVEQNEKKRRSGRRPWRRSRADLVDRRRPKQVGELRETS